MSRNTLTNPLHCTEKNYDYITFYRDDTKHERFGNAKYCGRQNDNNFPTLDKPLFIPSESFVIHFKTDGSNVDWGYRLVVWPAVGVTNTNNKFEEICTRSGAVVVESPHPYADNMNTTTPVQMNAELVMLAFHQDTVTGNQLISTSTCSKLT